MSIPRVFKLQSASFVASPEHCSGLPITRASTTPGAEDARVDAQLRHRGFSLLQPRVHVHGFAGSPAARFQVCERRVPLLPVFCGDHEQHELQQQLSNGCLPRGGRDVRVAQVYSTATPLPCRVMHPNLSVHHVLFYVGRLSPCDNIMQTLSTAPTTAHRDP